MLLYKIIKINAIDSSNNEIKRLYRQKLATNGLVVWVLEQKNGRGQGEKKWLSETNKNLTFSVFLDSNILSYHSQISLNLITSLTVKKVLNFYGISNLAIKWPNDILSVNKKISGILIENLYSGQKLNGSIVGVGININQLEFPSHLNATSMKILLKKELKLEKVLNCFLRFFSSNLETNKDFNFLKKNFNKNLYGIDKIIEIKIKGKVVKGRVIGLVDDKRFKIFESNGAIKLLKLTDFKIIG